MIGPGHRYFFSFVGVAFLRTDRLKLPVSPELGRPEHDEYRWVSFDEAEDLLPPRLAVVLEWAKKTITS